MSDAHPRDVVRRARLVLSCVLATGLAALPSGCLERRGEPGNGTGSSECTACHGDARRSGTALRRAAPPIDLSGATDPHYPGVGAHGIHLDATSTHGAVACRECHVVPEHTESPGHIDHPLPATISFGTLARLGGRGPSYDPIARTCRDTYCHRGADAVWTEARTAAGACGTCHGLPPPLPHPQSEQCSTCHGAVLDSGRHFVRPELHVDGAVEYTPPSCVACHGSGSDPAPPKDAHGNVSESAIGVGAHQVHLGGGSTSRPLQCSECHGTPARVDDPAHIEGLPARVTLTGVAGTDGRAPAWNHASGTCSDTWCHGPGARSKASPIWTVPGSLACTSCHGAPPAAPHPQLEDCSLCHGAVVAADDRTMIDRARHVNGIVDVAVPTSCTACHGEGTDPTPVAPQPGAGAHAAHRVGTATARAVPCGECHHVPATVLEPGHLDTGLPPSIVFSGVAAGGSPVFDNGTCRNTECHGAALPDGNPSGGSNTTPIWSVVDGSQDACGTCHGLPPPAPHPYGNLNPRCNACHGDIADDNRTFTHPELHVDGIVTFTVP